MRGRLAIATSVLTLALAAPATAHIAVSPEEAASDSFATLTFGVPHGCEGSPTTRVRISIPRSIPSVTPQVNPGWTIATREGPKEPVELHGEQVDRGVSEVIFTAKTPLADDRLDQLGMSVKLPAGAAGEAIRFPAIQTCAKGETAWIEVPGPGQTDEDLEEPAPTVTLTSASEPAAEAVAEDDDGPSTGLVVAALALGGLGLATAIAALLAARRRPA